LKRIYPLIIEDGMQIHVSDLG